MTTEQFADLLISAIQWECEVKITECEEQNRRRVTLTLWGKTITEEFHAFGMRWFSESGNGIIVDTPLTVWQWVAMRFADQIGGNVE